MILFDSPLYQQVLTNNLKLTPQKTNTCSKLIMETLEKSVKNVQN